MSTFSATLREFHRGARSITELETLIERDIALGSVAPDQLLQQLDAVEAELPLAPDAMDTLRRCITSAATRLRTQAGGGRTFDDPGAEQHLNKPGDVINGRFVLEAEVGRGGMSQVFRAVDKRKLEARSRDPYVALKVMIVEGVDPQDAFMAMQREAQKSQQLNHPNILRVNDFDRDGSIVYTTMEFLTGESLNQTIARAGPQGIPIDKAIGMINAMGSALAYAHESRIVHADFKPNNVFITRQGIIKVIDFGIARALQAPDLPEEERTVFDPKVALGALTPAYASPEMLEDKDPDPRDDIYSLGCVAYELITGRHPFAKLCATQARDSGFPLKRPPNLTVPQWNALSRALAFEREERSPSVRDFLDELNGLKRPDRGRMLFPAVATVVVALAGAAGFWLWNSDPGPAAPAAAASAALRDCPTCPPLLVVAAGASAIGLPTPATGSEPASGLFEFPERTVTIARDFALGSREVSVGEFREFVQESGGGLPAATGCRTAASNWQPDPRLSWENPGFTQTDDHPVTCVTWNDATAYAAWLSRRTGNSYRLPSETEWEYVARAHAQLPLTVSGAAACAGANAADQSAARAFPDLRANDCRDGFVYTAPVSRSPDTVFADLRGNVFEWTQDCWNPGYEGAPSDGAAWEGGDCGSRVLRGGSWYTAPSELRLTYRNRFESDYRSNTFGFRIARDIDPDEQQNLVEPRT